MKLDSSRYGIQYVSHMRNRMTLIIRIYNTWFVRYRCLFMLLGREHVNIDPAIAGAIDETEKKNRMECLKKRSNFDKDVENCLPHRLID